VKPIYFVYIGLLLVTIIVEIIAGGARFIPGVIGIYIWVLSCIYTGRWICRKWLLTKRYVGLFAVLIGVLVGYDVLGLLGSVYLLDAHIPMDHVLESSINIMGLAFVLLFAGFFISVIRSAIKEKMNGLVLAEQQKANELTLLQSQVSPHFLFNTLNNMYSLSINRPAQMPDLLLKLSGLLRYSVYEASQPLVTLKEELEYIRNYIALESIRVSDRLLLVLNIETSPAAVKIAPMILIVFVENAFKHARNTLEQHIDIRIDAKVENDLIYFNVINSCPEEEKERENVESMRSSGFGIENVIKRLDLLYPGEYSLKQGRQQDLFEVELWLKAR
jgi:sensor histidine kinase YesM